MDEALPHPSPGPLRGLSLSHKVRGAGCCCFSFSPCGRRWSEGPEEGGAAKPRHHRHKAPLRRPKPDPPMKSTCLLLSAAFLMTLSAVSTAASLSTPPDAGKKPHVVKAPFGAQREDEYYWLRDDARKNARDAGLPQCRERLRRCRDGAAEAAGEQAVRGDRQPHQAGRQLGAVPRTRLLVLHAASRPARTIRSTRRRKRHDRWTPPRRSCSTSTRWPRTRTTSASATGPSARTTACWPGPRTRSAAASTPCASRTSPPARSSPTRSRAYRPTWSGPTTTARCSMSRTIPRPCSPCA